MIKTEFPFWFFLLCLFLGLLYAVVLYYKNRNYEFSPWIIKAMFLLRFFVISIIAFLLLSPLLKTTLNNTEKPIVIMAQDNSESIIAGKDSVSYFKNYLSKYYNLSGKLEDKYDVREIVFGDNITEKKDINFSEKQTDISSVFNEIKAKYSNRNIGALILASDGLYNKGVDPLYSLRGLDFPIYTIALGDTNVRKDIILSKVNFNRLVFYGNDFPVEIVIKADKCKGSKSKVLLKHNDEILYTEVLNIASNNFIKTIPLTLNASDTGLQHYNISVGVIEDEVSISNNSQDIFVDIIDSRQKIMLLANSPHPDVAALISVLEKNDNYQVDEFIAGESIESVDNYDMVVFHQIPSMKYPASKISKRIIEKGIPVLYILGSQTYLNLFNQLRSGVRIFNDKNHLEEMLPFYEKKFSLFLLSKSVFDDINNFPPLMSLSGRYEISNSSNVLFYQKKGNIVTPEPMILFNQNIDSKCGIIVGEGLWRWKLYDYLKNDDNDSFNELILKMIQYLSVKTDKSYFRISSKNKFAENKNIEFNAEVYNKSYELINDPEIEMEILDKNGKKYQFVFGRDEKSYYLNAGSLTAGSYKYFAKVNFEGNIFKKSGEFIITPLNIETLRLVANHNLLFKLAKNSGGEMFYPQQIDKIITAIDEREDISSITYSQKRFTELIDIYWIIIVILGLLTIEWFIRRRGGGY